MPLRIIDDSNADSVLSAHLADAVSALNSKRAFESLYIGDSQDIPIFVADGLFGFHCQPSRFDQGDSAFRFNPTQIYVGSQVLTDQGVVGQLRQFGADDYESVFCCLAHELFHVDESHRLSSQGVSFYEANSKFSLAVRPSFPLECNELLRTCARKYQGAYTRDPESTFQKLPIAVARAQDISSELCADLLAFYWMRQSGIDTSSMEKAVLKLRIRDEASSLLEYQIGSEMPSYLHLNSFDDIVNATMSRCIHILSTDASIDPVIQNIATSISRPIAMIHRQSDIQSTLPQRTPSLLEKASSTIRSVGTAIKKLGR